MKLLAEEIALDTTKTLSYTGIFSIQHLYDMFDQYLLINNYDKFDIRHDVKVINGKKHIEIITVWTRRFTDAESIDLEFVFKANDLQKVEVQMDGEKKKQLLDNGSFSLYMGGYINIDQDSKWKSLPFGRLIRLLGTWWIFKDEVDNIKKQAESDLENIYTMFANYVETEKYLR